MVSARPNVLVIDKATVADEIAYKVSNSLVFGLSRIDWFRSVLANLCEKTVSHAIIGAILSC